MYMRRTGVYGIENRNLMEKFKQWTKSQTLMNVVTVLLGIAQDNPACTAPENCRYDCCLVTEEGQASYDKFD
jgi:DNA gyrase inhibitor GyrI